MSPTLNTHLLSATPVSNDFNYWTLTEFGSGQHQNRCITLPGRQISIGRSPDAGIVVNDGSVSKLHAEIYFENGEPFVRDLDSRNGTFINCRPIRIDAVREGDLLQFANAVYRVGYVRQEAPKTIEQGISIWANSLLLFDELISKRAVIPFYQPIIDLRTNHKLGFEVLARSALEGLKTPYAMFQVADRLNQNSTLSEMMREEGLRGALRSEYAKSVFFLNTHPTEVVTDRLCNSLRELRRKFPDVRIMLEIHEAAIVEPKSILSLRELLNELDISLSYDDFGAGQGRLVELGEAPPDVLKFDMRMIRDIDKAPRSKQEFIASLVRLANDLGCNPLAEGVKTEEESVVCKQMGFCFGQGYLYGKPGPFESQQATP